MTLSPLSLSRVFCVAAGGGLLATTLGALVFTDFDLATGDELPHQTWNFFFAFNTWRRLTWVDENLLRPFVPKALFYNALVTGTKP